MDLVRGAITKTPGSVEVIERIDGVTVIEINDGLFGQLFPFVVGCHRERREEHAVRLQYHVVSDKLGGSQIFLQQIGRHP